MLAGALLSSHYCYRLSIDVLIEAVALDVPGLTALVARGGVFQIFCEGDQLGPFGLQLCAGCDGRYAWRACVLVGACEGLTRVCSTRSRPSMAACFVCGAVRSRAVLNAAGCAVYIDIEFHARVLGGCAYGMVFGICSAWLCA